MTAAATIPFLPETNADTEGTQEDAWEEEKDTDLTQEEAAGTEEADTDKAQEEGLSEEESDIDGTFILCNRGRSSGSCRK